MIPSIRSKRSSSVTFFVLLSLLIIAPVALLVMLSQNFYQEPLVKQDYQSVQNQAQRPFVSMNSVALLQISPQKKYQLHAKVHNVQFMKNTSQLICSDIEAVFSDNADKKTAKNNICTMHADEGFINIETGESHFSGKIQTIIESHGSQQQP